MSYEAELSDLHLRILSILWERRTASVAQLHAALKGNMRIAPKTIATLLSRMESRGLVEHSLVGRENVYRPIVSRRRVLMARVKSVLAPLFPNEAAGLGARALDASEIRPGDSKRILELLRRAARDLGGSG